MELYIVEFIVVTNKVKVTQSLGPYLIYHGYRTPKELSDIRSVTDSNVGVDFQTDPLLDEGSSVYTNNRQFLECSIT